MNLDPELRDLGDDDRAIQDSINRYWDLRARDYDAYQQRPERRDLDREVWGRIWRDALPPAAADVLDLGTGSGHVAMLLAEMGHRVTATDLSEEMLAQARRHAQRLAIPPRFVVGDAVVPGFPAASFDAITNRYLMWTLRDPKEALASWRRLLRPGGVLAVVDAPWFVDGLDANPTERFAEHYDGQVRTALPLAEARTIDATAALVEAAGFEQVEVMPLTSVLELDRSYGVAPGHDVQLQYLVTARS